MHAAIVCVGCKPCILSFTVLLYSPSLLWGLLSVSHEYKLRNLTSISLPCRTYGKGLIQSVYELSDSSGLVLTVGKYLTPLRTDIDREGLKPDFRHMPSSSAAAEQLQACRLSHEA